MVITDIVLDLVQGWTSVIPKFSVVDFFSFYLQVFVMIVMFIGWVLVRRITGLSADPVTGHPRPLWQLDIVNTNTVDLFKDEHFEEEVDKADDDERRQRLTGPKRFLWRLYYWVV